MSNQDVVTVLKEQIALSKQKLAVSGFDTGPVRERVGQLLQPYGSPALDVGTGACACMAVALARRGLRVTAIDHASSAVRIAQERSASKLDGLLELDHTDATHLPYSDGSYQSSVAFDSLCHASHPETIIGEMFRVSNAVVVISELNYAGREITHHHDGNFQNKLPDLLAAHCEDCLRFDDKHHVTYVCKKS